MKRDEIERYNSRYNYFFERDTEPTPRETSLTNDALMTELDDLVQVLTLKDTADYYDLLNGSEPGRRYNAIKAELVRRLNNREEPAQPAKVERCYSFVCMNAMISNRLFIESAFNGDEDAIKTAIDYEATLYKVTLVDGKQTETELLYDPTQA